MAEDYKSYFDIEKELGRGGFGTVYKVKSRKDHKKYALKVVSLDSYQVPLKEVKREFSLTASLDHPNIVNVYKDFASVDHYGCVTSYAIQMEYCPNGDLSTVLEERNGSLFRRKKLLDWMGDLASALEYIHSKDVLHRDLKPDNILLDKNHDLRISDFGIGKVMTQYYATTQVGTPYFLAPEVLNGRYTKKADVYSMGQVFMCMATLSEIPGDPDDLPKRYDDDIYGIISDCVEERSKDRPTATELLDRIEAIE